MTNWVMNTIRSKNDPKQFSKEYMSGELCVDEINQMYDDVNGGETRRIQ